MDTHADWRAGVNAVAPAIRAAREGGASGVELGRGGTLSFAGVGGDGSTYWGGGGRSCGGRSAILRRRRWGSGERGRKGPSGGCGVAWRGVGGGVALSPRTRATVRIVDDGWVDIRLSVVDGYVRLCFGKLLATCGCDREESTSPKKSPQKSILFSPPRGRMACDALLGGLLVPAGLHGPSHRPQTRAIIARSPCLIGGLFGDGGYGRRAEAWPGTGTARLRRRRRCGELAGRHQQVLVLAADDPRRRRQRGARAARPLVPLAQRHGRRGHGCPDTRRRPPLPGL